MLAAIKHVTDDNFVFQQDSTLAHCARNTVQLLRHGILNFLVPELRPPNTRELISID